MLDTNLKLKIEIRNDKAYKHNFTIKTRMFPSDPKGSLDDSFHILSPRYLRKDMPGFLFTSSRRYL